MKKISLIVVLSFLLLPILTVKAETFDFALNIDQNSYTYNDEVNVKLSASNLPSYGLSSGQFYLTYDTNYYSFACSDIKYKQNVNANEIDCSESNGKIILLYVDDDGGDSPIKSGEFLNVIFKVKKSVTSTSSTTFSLSGDGFAGVNSGSIVDYTSNGNPTKSISIVKQKNNDIYLKSLSITGYSLNFSKNKYEYSIEVENEVNSITINASTNSSSSTVSGTGTKSLSEGDNKFTLTVTAENGDKQNYIVNVKRKLKETNENVNNNNNQNENNNIDNSTNQNNQTNNDRIEGTVESPKTGVYSYIIAFSLIILISGVIYFKMIKKNKFPKI